MPLHPVAKRRIAILAVGLGLIVAGVIALYVYQNARRRTDAMDHRDAGMAAFEAENYRDAAFHLGKYLIYEEQDVEALHRYAKAQLKTPQPNLQHYRQAVRALRRAHTTAPDHEPVSTDLLDLYVLLNQDEEALSLADARLRTNENDAPAHRARAISLARQRRHDQASDAAERAIALDPLNVDMQLLFLEMQDKLHSDPESLIIRANRLKAAYPTDPRFDLVQAYAYHLAGERQRMVGTLRHTATQPPPDAEYAVKLVRFLDAAGLYPVSLVALINANDHLDDANLRREMLKRMLEHNLYADVADQLNDADPSAAPVDLEAVTLRVLSLHYADRDEQAARIADELAQVGGSPASKARGATLRALYGQEDYDLAKVIEACQADLKLSPNSPYIHAILGDAYYATGEPELALNHWQAAAQQRPSWSRPRTQQVQPLVALGKNLDALREAESALVRSPGSASAYRAWALARSANLKTSQRDSADQILKVIDTIDKVAPGDEQMLMLRVALLEDTERGAEAGRVISDALAGDYTLSEAVLLDLADRSRRLGLGLEGQLYDRSADAHGVTANLTLIRATRLAEAGRSEEGLALFDQARRGHEQDLDWRLVWAQYLDAIGDERAAEQWMALSKDHPGDNRIQLKVLRAKSMKSRRDFTEQVITNMRDLAGAKSLNWRIEQARWLLDGPVSEQSASEASRLLREVLDEAPSRTEARALLARAMEQLGRVPLAIREMRLVAQARPDSPAVALELARLNQALRAYRNAREQLVQVVGNPASTPAMLRQAAAMLAAQGDDDVAIGLFERLRDNGNQPVQTQDELMLASLYVRNEQADKAEAIAARLLNDPTPAVVAWSANFYATQGRADDAQRVLALLDGLEMGAAERAALRADFAARHGDAEQALALERTAVDADPKNPAAWKRLVGRHVLAGDGDAAVRTAEEALASLPDEPALGLFVEHGDLVRALAPNEQYRGLVGAMLSSERDAAATALLIIERGQKNNDAAFVSQLRELADANPQLLSVQTALARLYLRGRRYEMAADVAISAADAFPTAVEPAYLATEALLRLNQPDKALLFARQWRQRTPTAPRAADLQIAEAELRMGNGRGAMTTLKPYINAALEDPDANEQVIARYARGLVIDGKLKDARRMLEPLVKDSPQWRNTAMKLATLGRTDTRDASAWLETIEASVPEDAIDERVELARAWWVIGTQVGATAARDHTRRIIDAVTARPDANAAAWFFRGIVAETESDLPTAVASYRQALALSPDVPATKNNLAMALAELNESPEEALRMAAEAVEAEPANPSYLDTLAFVQTQAGLYDEAIANMQRAVELDPRNPKWKRHLARILADAGHTEEADQVLRELQSGGLGTH